MIDHHWQRGGASTLATQTVKFRESPGGRTDKIGEKLRQMVTAAADAYRDGPDTLPARQNILVTYLNSTPLASYPGYGEVIGLPEAMWIWYGTDFAEADSLLDSAGHDPAAAGGPPGPGLSRDAEPAARGTAGRPITCSRTAPRSRR